MDPIPPSNTDTPDQHLIATGSVECSEYLLNCRDYNPFILFAYIAGVSVFVLLLVFLWYAVRSRRKKNSARQQHQRHASQILPLYLGSGQGFVTPGAGGDFQLRRLSRRVSMPLPMHMQRQRSGADGGANVVATDGSPGSVGSVDTVIRRELSPDGHHWLSHMGSNNIIVLRDPSHAVQNGDTMVLTEVSRVGIPGAAHRTASVDTLPRYEEIEPEGGWKKEQLSGGMGRAV